MDIVTQGLVGGLVAQTCADKKEIRHASVIGFVAGLLADVDTFFSSSRDPLLSLEFHRFFTHSIFFIPIGGLIAALLTWYFFRKKLSFVRVYLFAILGYATCGLLDACTSYGTSLLWPVVDEKVSWNIIAIVDPAFSLIILFFLAVGFIKHKSRFAVAGVVLGCSYLLMGLWQNQQIKDIVRQIADANGHSVQSLVIKPTLGNIILWRTLYEHDGVYYVNAIRKGIFSEPKIYSGKSIIKWTPQVSETIIAKSSKIYRDIKRFDTFSRGYLVKHPDYPNVIGDVRYAMLPNSIKPLWGIELNYQQDKVEFKNFRNMDSDTLNQFISMLFEK